MALDLGPITPFEIVDFRRLVATGRYVAERTSNDVVELHPADPSSGDPHYAIFARAEPLPRFIAPPESARR